MLSVGRTIKNELFSLSTLCFVILPMALAISGKDPKTYNLTSLENDIKAVVSAPLHDITRAAFNHDIGFRQNTGSILGNGRPIFLP